VKSPKRGGRAEKRQWDREEIDRDLARRIAAWAKSWEHCPLAGCRRNNRCLKSERCRAVGDRPFTHEDGLAIGEQIRALIARGEPTRRRE